MICSCGGKKSQYEHGLGLWGRRVEDGHGQLQSILVLASETTPQSIEAPSTEALNTSTPSNITLVHITMVPIRASPQMESAFWPKVSAFLMQHCNLRDLQVGRRVASGSPMTART